mgnify:CR=1 FL=1
MEGHFVHMPRPTEQDQGREKSTCQLERWELPCIDWKLLRLSIEQRTRQVKVTALPVNISGRMSVAN